MMRVYWTILAMLATYRAALMLSNEEGPFGVFLGMRNLHTADDWLGRGLRCFRCWAFWLALLAARLIWIQALALTPSPSPAGSGELALLWFGIAGGAVMLDKYWNR